MAGAVEVEVFLQILVVLVFVALAYGLLAEILGMHWILGAFVAGLYFEGARVGEAVYRDIRVTVAAITGGVLGPFFFVSISLAMELEAIAAVPVVLSALIALSFAGKALVIMALANTFLMPLVLRSALRRRTFEGPGHGDEER